MSSSRLQVSQCTCEICRLGVEHPQQKLHQHINLVMSRLDEQQRRWVAGLVAEQYGLGLGGIRMVSQVTGLSEKTIRRGLVELRAELNDRDENRVRKAGAGRPKETSW